MARSDMSRRLLRGVRADRCITLSMLSSDGAWVVLFNGPVNQLDLTWVASMSPVPLCSHVYRVEGATGPNELSLTAALAPRDVTYLSDPEAPTIINASTRDVILGWPGIEGCRGELLRQAVTRGGAAFQVEIKEGPGWQPARVQLQRLRVAARATGSQNSDCDRWPMPGEVKTLPANRKDGRAYVALEAVDGVGGVRVIDLLPATWYHMRLRVTYDGISAALSPAVAVATKCGAPDPPIPRPNVTEEFVGTANMNSVVGAAAQNLEGFVSEMSRATPPPASGSHRLRVSWARPRTNGYPIQYYILHQRELVLPPNSVAKRCQASNMLVPARSLASDPRVRPFSTQSSSNANEQQQAPKWTPWREVHAHLLPECLVRAPSRCPASITAARQTLGLGSPSNNSAALGSGPFSSLPKVSEPPPRFIAVEFRVAAVNALGASKFSQVSRVSRQVFPRAPEQAWGGRTAQIKTRRSEGTAWTKNLQTSMFEAELEELAGALGFPVSLSIVQGALELVRGKKSFGKTPSRASIIRNVGERRNKLERKSSTKADPSLYSPAQHMIMTEMARISDHEACKPASFSSTSTRLPMH